MRWCAAMSASCRRSTALALLGGMSGNCALSKALNVQLPYWALAYWQGIGFFSMKGDHLHGKCPFQWLCLQFPNKKLHDVQHMTVCSHSLLERERCREAYSSPFYGDDLCHTVVPLRKRYAQCDDLYVILCCNYGVSFVRPKIAFKCPYVITGLIAPQAKTFRESAPSIIDFAVCCSKILKGTEHP